MDDIYRPEGCISLIGHPRKPQSVSLLCLVPETLRVQIPSVCAFQCFLNVYQSNEASYEVSEEERYQLYGLHRRHSVALSVKIRSNQDHHGDDHIAAPVGVPGELVEVRPCTISEEYLLRFHFGFSVDDANPSRGEDGEDPRGMLHNHEIRDLVSESTNKPHREDVCSDPSHHTCTTALQEASEALICNLHPQGPL